MKTVESGDGGTNSVVLPLIFSCEHPLQYYLPSTKCRYAIPSRKRAFWTYGCHTLLQDDKISWLNKFLGYVLCLAFLPSLDNFGYELAWWVLVPLKHAINAYMDCDAIVNYKTLMNPGLTTVNGKDSCLASSCYAYKHPTFEIPKTPSVHQWRQNEGTYLCVIDHLRTGNGNGVLERESDERERGYWDLRGNS
ncbi:hypothetical protein R6Q59_025578 [Mikania micrantha]